MTDPDNQEPSGAPELEAAVTDLIDPDNLLIWSVEDGEINPDKLAAYFLDKIRNLLILQTPEAEESLRQSVDDLEQVLQKSPQWTKFLDAMEDYYRMAKSMNEISGAGRKMIPEPPVSFLKQLILGFKPGYLRERREQTMSEVSSFCTIVMETLACRQKVQACLIDLISFSVHTMNQIHRGLHPAIVELEVTGAIEEVVCLGPQEIPEC